MLSELLRHREYIWRNSLLELRHRYAGSALGPVWLVLYPVAQILIYSLVFSEIMRARVPELAELRMSFTLYLCTGLLPWIGFAEIVSRSTSSLLENASYITRTALPEQIFFAQNAFAGFLRMLLTMAILLVAAVAVGLTPSTGWLALPLVLALFASFAFGVGMLLGVLNVFSRDVTPVVEIALQIAMWTAPIVYVESILPESLQALLPYNPIYHYVSALHQLVLFGRWPDAMTWAAMVGLSSLAIIISLELLRSLRAEVRDAL